MSYKHPFLIQHVIDQTAERFPDKPLFRFEDQALTYAQAAARTNSLAHHLVDRGVQRSDRVGIFMHKSMESAVALFGILKAGAAYVPINPSSPAQRIEILLRDCGIQHIITEPNKLPSLLQALEGYPDLQSITGVSLPEANPSSTQLVSWDEVYQYPEDAPPVVPGLIAEELAYIMYTSGSTGTPKGMMHSHFSGLSYAKAAASLYSIEANDVLSNHSPLHYDMSTFDFFSGPLCGATTIIIPEEYKMLPASLSELIQDERMTIWYSVTTALVELLLRGVLEMRDLSALRWILFGGELFPPQHLKEMMAALPQARFSNVYGPSEVNQVTHFEVPSLPNKYEQDYVPIGQLLDDVDGIVIDDEDELVFPGEVGELLICGATRMLGYWNRPELTEQSFLRLRPFPGSNYEKIYYRTGDMVRLDEKGELHFLGRRDRQVKVRGYRIELDEIEAAISVHPAVGETAVYLLGEDEEAEIEAAVVLRSGQTVTTAELFKHVATLLPPEAHPSRFVFHESFPRTGSGKISRRILQSLSQALSQESNEH